MPSRDDDAGFQPTLAPDAVGTTVTSLPPPSASSSGGVIRGNPGGVATSGAGDHDGLKQVDPANYVLGAELARGGMGRILHARDRWLHRPIAIKELLAHDPALAERFRREILLTARLQHPSIVSIYEAGAWPGGEPFYAMRAVPGKSLDAIIAPLATSAERMALLPNAIAVTEALAYAHAQRIIHRDLKPGNVLVGPFGETVVIDWGLAKDLAALEAEPEVAAESSPYREAAPAEGLTLAGAVMGSPAYMPPEQAHGDAVDERADVYALGALLYHVLGGTPPFTGQTSEELLVKVLTETPRPLAQLAPDVPADLVAIVDKAMAHDARDRYPTAAELAADLKRFQTGQLVGARAYTRFELVRRWLARHRAAVSIALLAVVALAVGGSIMVRNVVRARDRAERARAAAVRAKDEAIVARAQLYQDQGRQELLAGQPLRAAAWLGGALGDADGALTRLLLGLAVDATATPHQRYPGTGDPVLLVAFGPGGTTIVTATLHGHLRVVDAATGAVTRTVEAGAIDRAVLAPDGSAVATVSYATETLDVWPLDGAAHRGRPVHSLRELGAVAYSPDGRWLATTGSYVAVFDARSLETVDELLAYTDGFVRSVAFSADGGRLAFGGSGGHVAVIDTARWFPVCIGDAKGEVLDVAFRPDGHRLAYVSYEVGEVLDLDHGCAAVATLEGSHRGLAGAFTSVAYSADGSALALSTDDAARLVDAVTGQTRRELTGYTTASFSPDGARLVSRGPRAGALGVWDVATGTLVTTLAGHALDVTATAFTGDGHGLVTASRDGGVVRWDLAATRGLALLPVDPQLDAPTYSPDGAWLLVDRADPHGHCMLDLLAADTGALVRTLHQPDDDPAVRQDPTGDRWYCQHVGGVLGWTPAHQVLTGLGSQSVPELWDPVAGRRVAAFMQGGGVRDAGVVADGRAVYVVTDSHVVLWQVTQPDAPVFVPLPAEGASIPDRDAQELAHRYHHAAAVVTSDGRFAVVPSPDGAAVLALPDGKPLGTLATAGEVWWMVAAPTGDAVVIAGARGASLYDAASQRVLGSLSALGETAIDARFSRDGSALYVHGNDHAVRRWDTRSAGLLATVATGGAELDDFAISDDDGLLATVVGSSARLWEPHTGVLLAERDTGLAAVDGMRRFAAFAPHGSALVVGAEGAALRVWRLPRWTGTAAALATALRCEVPWQLAGGQLTPLPLPADCR